MFSIFIYTNRIYTLGVWDFIDGSNILEERNKAGTMLKRIAPMIKSIDFYLRLEHTDL